MRSDGVWVYGMLGKTKETVSEDGQISYTGKYNYLIHSNEGHIGTWLVDGDTVGQFTGLKDNQGKDVYEGDIVSYSDKRVFLDVAFSGGSFVLNREGKTYVYNINSKMLEVIGNIHEKTSKE